MRTTGRGAASLVMVLVLGACAAPIDVQTPTVAQTQAAPPSAPEPTPVMAPSVAPTSTFVAVGGAPQVDCGGEVISGADIDYIPGAQGVSDILAATQRFIGVRATDVIVVEPTVTVVVRDGQPIWRGEWQDGGNGFLLGSKLACQDAGIR